MIRSTLKSMLKKVLGQADSSPSSAPPLRPAKAAPNNNLGSELASIECGAQEVRERLEAGEPVVIVDVREIFELEQSGMLIGALHIPLRELPARWEELADADEIVCYCAAGARSLNAAHLLRENGLFNATSMEGGIAAWKAIGGQVERLKKEEE
jgi:rhodanese-related sulfurtransferase